MVGKINSAVKWYEGIFNSLIQVLSEMTQSSVRADVFGSVFSAGLHAGDDVFHTFRHLLNETAALLGLAQLCPVQKNVFSTGKVDQICSGLLCFMNSFQYCLN